jgi:hypothetical protein
MQAQDVKIVGDSGQPAGGPVPQQQYVTQTTTTTAPTQRNVCCFYYMLVVQVIIMILFGVSMGGLTAAPTDNVQEAYTSITGFAWEHVLFASVSTSVDTNDDGVNNDDALDISSIALYSSFNYVQAGLALGSSGSDSSGASSDLSYAVADWSKDKCEMHYGGGITVSAGGASTSYNPLGALDFCSKYGGSCQSSGKGAGALFVFCFLISLGLCGTQWMRINKDSSQMMLGSIGGQAVVLILAIAASIMFSLSCPVKMAIDQFNNNGSSTVAYALNGGIIMVAVIIAIIAVFVQICINACCTPIIADQAVITQTTTSTPMATTGVVVQAPPPAQLQAV